MAPRLRPTSKNFPIELSRRLTRLGKYVAAQIELIEKPIITLHELSLIVCRAYYSGQIPNLRPNVMDVDAFNRARRNLIRSYVLISDPDYSQRAYRILKNSDRPADEICCLVDPFCHLSHMSAMQWYGLTNRRPAELHLMRPAPRMLRDIAKSQMEKEIKVLHDEFGGVINQTYFAAMRPITHPKKVRGRSIHVTHSAHPGESLERRGSYAKISTIGQTFLDMLESPALCGGMRHVISVWQNHAPQYSNEIIDAVSNWHSSILKVRAGYILEEVIKLKDDRIDLWQKKYAQRGGSQVLDSSKPYAPSYSERWMISVNV